MGQSWCATKRSRGLHSTVSCSSYTYAARLWHDIKILAQGFLFCEDHAKISLFAKSIFAPNLNLASASRGPVAPSSFKHEALWGCLGVGAHPSAEKSVFSYSLHDLGLTLKTLYAGLDSGLPFRQAYSHGQRDPKMFKSG